MSYASIRVCAYCLVYSLGAVLARLLGVRRGSRAFVYIVSVPWYLYIHVGMYSVRLWIEAVVVVASLLDWEKGSSVACFRYKIGMYVLLDLFDFSVD